MHLPRAHKVYLAGYYRELFEIDGMKTSAFGKQHQMVKCVAVRRSKIGVFKQVGCKRLYYDIVMQVILSIKGADIDHRNCTFYLLHYGTKVLRPQTLR